MHDTQLTVHEYKGPWYGTSGPQTASIAIVGESWGVEERKTAWPFVGAAGRELTRILAEAGIDRNECFITNVVPEQPYGNDMSTFFYTNEEVKAGASGPEVYGLYPKPNVVNGLRNLHAQLEAVRPDIIVACGNYALWALTDKASITSVGKVGQARRKAPAGIARWRGSQIYTRPEYGRIRCVPIYHPAGILRQWHWRAITVHDLAERVVKPWEEPEYDLTVRPTYELAHWTITYLLRQLDEQEVSVAIDLETRNGYIACYGLAFNDRRAISIPFMCVENDEGYWPAEQEYELRGLLARLHRHPHLRVVGQNFLYDMQYLAAELMPVDPTQVFDTMVAQHLCWPGMQKGLDFISSMYCRHYVYWKDEGKLWDTSIPEDRYWEYNCKDACATYECATELIKLIDTLGFQEQWELMCAQLGMVYRMMLRGVRIDKQRRSELTVELLEVAQECENWLIRCMPADLIPQMKSKKAAPWYRSPKQQTAIFYDTLDLPVIRDRKSGSPTLNAPALVELGKREPALRAVFEHMEALRSINNFHNVLQTRLDSDERMRCSFNIAGTETFRWSSSENAFGNGTNLQNISKGTEDE